MEGVTVPTVLITVSIFIVGQAIALAVLIIATHVKTQTKIAQIDEKISTLGKASDAHEHRRSKLEEKVQGISRTLERHETLITIHGFARRRPRDDGSAAAG